MKIDRQSRQFAKKCLRACVRPNGSLDEQAVRDIVNSLVAEKPRNYLPILTRLQQLLDLALDERTVRVESATPLPDNGASIFADLEQRFGPASRNEYKVNPALLGGLLIRRGSNIWDGSVSGRLNRLELAFS